MGLLSSLTMAPLPWPWDAQAFTQGGPNYPLGQQTLAPEPLTLSLPLEAVPHAMSMQVAHSLL